MIDAVAVDIADVLITGLSHPPGSWLLARANDARTLILHLV